VATLAGWATNKGARKARQQVMFARFGFVRLFRLRQSLVQIRAIPGAKSSMNFGDTTIAQNESTREAVRALTEKQVKMMNRECMRIHDNHDSVDG
jgi:hypothetical protein